MNKDIEWLKEKVDEMYTHYSISNNLDFVAKREAITEISNLIDQLDEPEKPVIPQFVADFIKDRKHTDAYSLQYIFCVAVEHSESDKFKKEYDWVRENDELFARVWLDGFTVEKEKKYYVLNNCGRTILVKLFGKQIAPSQGVKLEDLGNNNSDYQFTEQEIKNYDKRYWQFAEEVAE